MVKKYLVSCFVCLGLTQTLMGEEGAGFDCCPQVIVSEPLDPCCVGTVYPYPANFSPCCGWDIYAQADFLYYSTSKDIVPETVINFSFDQTEQIALPQNTSYRPGFRVNVGTDLGSVVLDVSYLRFHPHNTSHFSAKDNGGIVFLIASPLVASPVFGQPRAFFQTVKASRHFSLDTAMISLQRPVYMGKKIIMNLLFGIRGTWIGEKWRIDANALNNPILAQIGATTASGVYRQHQKTWSVGPNLGFTATALLPCCFQLISRLDLALEYAEQYKSFFSPSFPGYPFALGNFTIRQRGNAPHMQALHLGELGIGWGNYFCCDRYHVNLTVSYNWVLNHVFVQSTPVSSAGIAFGPLHNYSIHGIAVGGRLDF